MTAPRGSRTEAAKVDSRRKSFVEALLNSFGGYPIAYIIGIIILPLSVEWIKEDPLTVSLLITAVYAVASFLRSYYLRRLFSRYGMEDNVAVLAFEGARKLGFKARVWAGGS